MTVETTRKSNLPAIICIGLLCAAAAVFGTGKYMSHRQTELLRSAIARIPAEYAFSVKDVGWDLFGRVLTLENVAFSVPFRQERASVTMETVTVEGLAFETLFTPGHNKLADSLTITGMKTAAGSFEAVTKHCVLTDFAADLPRAAAEWADDMDDFHAAIEHAGRLAIGGAAPAFTEAESESPPLPYSAKRFVSQGDRITFSRNGDTFELLIASSEITDLSPAHVGPITLTDVTITANGTPALTLATLGSAGFEGLLAGDTPHKDGVPLGQNPFDRDVRIENLHIAGMTLHVRMPGGKISPVTAENARLTVAFTDKGQTFDASLTALAVERELLLSRLGDATGLPLPPPLQLEDIAAFLPETLIIGGKGTVSAKPLPEEEVALVCDPVAVSIKGLGSMTLRLDVEGPEALEEDGQFKLLDASVTDEGVSEMIFALLGKMQGKTPKYARQEAAMALSMVAFAARGPFAELIANCLEFMEKPGATLTVRIEPKKPFNPEALGDAIVLSPEDAGLSSSVSRPAPSPAPPAAQ